MIPHSLRGGLLVLSLVAYAACQQAPSTRPTPLAHGVTGSSPDNATLSSRKASVQYLVDAVADAGPYDNPTWISSRPALTDRNTLYAPWKGDAVTLTPTAVGAGDCAAPADAPPTRTPYELGDEGSMTVRERNGTILGVTFYIQDQAGPAGVMHATDQVPVSSVESLAGGGFVLHVHQDHRLVYRLKGHTGGPRVATIGCISVADLVYTPS